VAHRSTQKRHSQRQRLPPTAATISQAHFLHTTGQAPLFHTTSQARSPPYAVVPTTISFTLAPITKYEEVVPEIRQLVCWAHRYPDLWEVLIGLYFQNSGRHPRDVAGHDTRGHELLRGRWEVDARKLDVISKDPTLVDVWRVPDGADGELLGCIAAWACDGRQLLFEEGIRRWTEDCAQLASRPDDTWLDRILYRSRWARDPSLSPDWLVMSNIKRMLPGTEKDEMLARTEFESPLFFARCMADANCG